jgi:ABC-type multidrug transport system fused ATPase/permease subunit
VLIGSINASRTFHSKAFSGVISAPMTWFYSNPAGRVINRFSKDVESVDQRLMPQVFQAVAGVSYLLSTVVILAHSAPVILGTFNLQVLVFTKLIDLIYL